VNRKLALAVFSVGLLMFGPPVVFASQPKQGFVSYSVTVSTPRGEHAALVTERVSATTKAGFSDVLLQIVAQQQNLTYSRLVNSSYVFFPYFSGIANQSFRYTNGTSFSIDAYVSSGGTTSVSFQNQTYALSSYTVDFTASYRNYTLAGSGSVSVFPSSLVYSVTAQSGGFRYAATLVSTDLPLSGPSTLAMNVAYAGAGAGIGGIALLGALLVRRRNRAAKAEASKPIHWVD